MKNYKLVTLTLALSFGFLAQAKERPDNYKRKGTLQALAEGCAPATAQTDLNINNVRTLILGGGDMWWDLVSAPRYEVPKDGGTHAMYAGALWLGGIDQANQLKLAAMTYRQSGVDYWPGPLTDDGFASVTQATCREYDTQWLITREQVETHAAWIECKESSDCDISERFPDYAGSIPSVITNWPGNGINGERASKLAPYIDNPTNGTPGTYDADWDYPAYDLNRVFNCKLKETDLLYGDQTIWWVYNDKGNVHTETNAGALGFEIRAQAFAFTSNDEINNMTFNNYRILNQSTFELADTYFGTWFDPDLGFAEDDIIGCDIARGLGYCYNSDADDEGPRGYGLNPPAVGFDFFQGPFADYFDGKDNDRDGCVDGVRDSLGVCITENLATGVNERIIMSGFMYFNNSGTGSPNENTTDPDNAQEFYNYLQSKWKNGNDLVIETPAGKGNLGNGDGFTQDGTGTPTLFAYPGESQDSTLQNPVEIANGGWWESPGNGKDKRGLHTAGPFSLLPGALNFITTGVVWSRNFASQDLFASVEDVIVADDKAQQLFDNCFQILDGPKTPELEIVELDEEIIINLTGAFDPATFNYSQRDPLIPNQEDWGPVQIDSARQAGYFNYVFEGFQIFQVSGPDVSVEDLYDASQSRLVGQSDLKNDIGQLVNYTTDTDLDDAPLVPVDRTLISNNAGIQVSYSIVEDEFATDDKTLINDKEYYFYVLAYSQNNYIDFDPRSMGDDANAQKTPYLAGRDLGNGQQARLAIPTKSQPRNNGTVLNSAQGDELQITRLAGAGNGGNFIEIDDEMRDAIATSYEVDEIEYIEGAGPFEIKVANPFDVVSGDYTLSFENTSTSPSWAVTDVSGRTVYSSINTIDFLGEELIDTLGLIISFTDQLRPGNDTLGTRDNGVIGGQVTYDDQKLAWLSGVQDDDSFTPTNWILAGSARATVEGIGAFYADINPDGSQDNQGFFEGILDGTWAPLFYGSNIQYDATESLLGFGVKPDATGVNGANPADLINVDIVITKDPSKWTRVPVLETSNLSTNNIGGAERFTLRQSATLNKNADGTLTASGSVDLTDFTSYGWSYFPGYAVNVETGRRLHMAFGESSYLRSENGDDLLWNPTPNENRIFDIGFGGMHVLYVFGDSTDTEDLTYRGDNITDFPFLQELEDFTSTRQVTKINAQQAFFNAIHWTTIPLTTFGLTFEQYSEIPTDAVVSLRVDKPYQKVGNSSSANNGYPQYEFSTNGKASILNDPEAATSALDLVNIVPNPYYGGSLYEDTQLDNIVKINNLPPTCDINIYMTNGTLVRNISKANSLTYVEWDMTNDYNVPITSGVYIIHVDAGTTGETVRKFVCTMRPVDLNAF